MNCNTCIERLDDYLDGELAAADIFALEQHARQCAACSRTVDAARTLQRRAFALPSELPPAQDLWPGIAAHIESRTRRQRHANWLRAIAATLAAVAIFGGGMLVDRVMQESSPDVAPMYAENPATTQGTLPTAAEARRVLPASHVELIEGSGSGLQAGAEQDLLRNLLVVNLAIRRVEGAVEQDPTNSNLRELLADLYSRENRILIEAERFRVEQSSPTRTGI